MSGADTSGESDTSELMSELETDESESMSELDETGEADESEVMRRLYWAEAAENKNASQRAQYAPSEPENDVLGEDSSDEDSEDESHLDWEVVQSMTREFAKQLLEAVGTGTLTMKGVDVVLKVLHTASSSACTST